MWGICFKGEKDIRTVGGRETGHVTVLFSNGKYQRLFQKES